MEYRHTYQCYLTGRALKPKKEVRDENRRTNQEKLEELERKKKRHVKATPYRAEENWLACRKGNIRVGS